MERLSMGIFLKSEDLNDEIRKICILFPPDVNVRGVVVPVPKPTLDSEFGWCMLTSWN